MLKYEAVLFDMDGTIFDTESIYRLGWVETAKQFGVEFKPETYNLFAGVHSDQCFQMASEMFGAAVDMKAFTEYKHQFVLQQKAKHVAIKKGFDSYFKHCLTQGFKIGLVTSSDKAAVARNFAKTDLLPHFQTVVTGEDVARRKPEPDCYLLACRQLGVAPEKAIVFEDSNPGARAGIRAGCATVMIPDILDAESDVAQDALAVIDSFDQACSVFENTVCL